jgi:hypothetical protein
MRHPAVHGYRVPFHGPAVARLNIDSRQSVKRFAVDDVAGGKTSGRPIGFHITVGGHRHVFVRHAVHVVGIAGVIVMYRPGEMNIRATTLMWKSSLSVRRDWNISAHD